MLLGAPNSNTLGGLWVLDSQRLDCRLGGSIRMDLL